MRKLLVPCLLIFTLFLNAQDVKQPAEDQKPVVIFSSYTSEDKLEQFVADLGDHGIDFVIEDIAWKNENQLAYIKFEINRADGRSMLKMASRKYNLLNEGTVLMFSESGIVESDLELSHSEIWDVIVNKKKHPGPKKVISTFHEVISTASQEDVDALWTDIRDHFADNMRFVAEVKADKDFSTKNHNYRYYYNGTELADSFTIHAIDMTSDVVLRTDPDGKQAVYFTSTKPMRPESVLATK